MEFKKLCVVVTTLLAQSSFAADWVTIASPPWPPQEGVDYHVEADRSSVRTREGHRQAWVRFNYAAPKTVGNVYLYRSIAQLKVIDCKNEESAAMESVYYKEKFSQGEIISSYRISRTEAIKNLSPVVPQTLDEAILQWTCGQKAK